MTRLAAGAALAATLALALLGGPAAAVAGAQPAAATPPAQAASALIPEPASLALAGAGLVGMGLWRRRPAPRRASRFQIKRSDEG